MDSSDIFGIIYGVVMFNIGYFVGHRNACKTIIFNLKKTKAVITGQKNLDKDETVFMTKGSQKSEES